jgi:hypothetical protein
MAKDKSVFTQTYNSVSTTTMPRIVKKKKGPNGEGDEKEAIRKPCAQLFQA